MQPNYDLRDLLGGTNNVMKGLTEVPYNQGAEGLSVLESLADLPGVVPLPPCMHAAGMMLEAVSCLPLDPSTRSSTGRILAGIQAPDMLYAMLIADYQLVAMVQPKNKEHALHPQGKALDP